MHYLINELFGGHIYPTPSNFHIYPTPSNLLFKMAMWA